jgi:hypothetical protein
MDGHACNEERLFRGDDSEPIDVTHPISFKVRQIRLRVSTELKHLYEPLWYAGLWRNRSRRVRTMLHKSLFTPLYVPVVCEIHDVSASDSTRVPYYPR